MRSRTSWLRRLAEITTDIENHSKPGVVPGRSFCENVMLPAPSALVPYQIPSDQPMAKFWRYRKVGYCFHPETQP